MPTIEEFREAANKVMHTPEFQHRADGILENLLAQAGITGQDVPASRLCAALSLTIFLQAQLLREMGWCAEYQVQHQTIVVCMRAITAIQEMGWNMIQEQLKETANGQETP